MTIKLPAEAEEYFDKKASELLLLLYPKLKDETPKPKSMMSDDQKVTIKLDEREIGGFNLLGTMNGFGNQTSRYFQSDKGPIGLAGENYLGFAKLFDQLASRSELRKLLSKECVEDIFFEWFEKRYKGKLDNSLSFTRYLKDRSTEKIKHYKISIPISFLAIEEPFQLGRVTFEYFKKDFFDEFEQATCKKNPNNEATIKESMQNIRKRFQGVVFSTMTIEAEKDRCIEIAKQETEKALVVLRFFSPWAFFPENTAYFGRMGWTNVPIDYIFVFEDRFPNITEAVDEYKELRFPLNVKDVAMFKSLGLERASNLIAKDKLTELEDLLFNSMFLFSRSVVAPDFQDKLVYCLVAVETLLLKNETEPIQSSVGLRLAFLAAQSVDKRRKVMKLIRDAYKLRSSYIHHGSVHEDLETLRSLRIVTWESIRNVLFMTDKYSTQKDLLDFIEEKCLSG
ncbi:MAG: hypothetical protein KKF20_02915 [Bacteroidetes bacterium]|nr:hypothetical protein [Bacteroidota bacterium]MBU1423969.1 hypothetical protein [Bacteroidota bacterium]MBU2471341.1 hypothetical protein [Bacteroidota bacterium]MBU2635651.1 hypothetical protein [Bacteroidota bacterium]